MSLTLNSQITEDSIAPPLTQPAPGEHYHPSGPVTAIICAITPAMLALTPVFAPFLSLRHRFIYHEDGSAATIMAALLVNLVAGWLLFAALFLATELWPRLRPILWTLLVAVLPRLLVRDYTAVTDQGVPRMLGHASSLFALVIVAAAALLWRYRRPRFLSALAIAQTLTVFLSIGWLVTVAQLATYAVTTRGLNAPRPLHQAAHPAFAAAAHPRVIWIIFDELGFRPTFQGRPAGVSLPAFDALAAESTNFTKAVSPGLYTEYVVPRLLLARPKAAFNFTSFGQLEIIEGPPGPPRAFAPRDTVFGDALRDGYTTAVVGWHNPYCRILNSVLDSCFWTARVNSSTADFDGQSSFAENVLGPARHFWRTLRYRDSNAMADAAEGAQHIDDLQRLMQHADAVLRTDDAGFVLIHLPVPHPSGIWSRSRASFDTSGHGSYVDNLVLADRVLAHLRDELVARHQWDSSAIVVMGDHSWRTSMRWQGTRGWTQEDQAVSGGTFDPRPVYLVKLPEQQTPATFDRTFPTYRTRALLDVVMSHSGMNTPADLARWAAQP